MCRLGRMALFLRRCEEGVPTKALGECLQSKGGEVPSREMGNGFEWTFSDQASGRMEELQRNATSLLNKICPDNLATIVDQLANIQLHKAEELEWVIRIIFKKALAEPHYCTSEGKRE